MNNGHATQRYRQIQVNTASKDELLLLLLDGGVRFAETGLRELEGDDEDRGKRNESLQRAQNIVLELMGSLSPAIGLELFQSLQQLYRFTFSRLFEGNCESDRQKVEEGVVLFRQIRAMWTEAVQKARAEKSVAPQKGAPNSNVSFQG